MPTKKEWSDEFGRESECKWKCNVNDWADWWDTGCGGSYTIMEGTPKENKMRFCPYCGGKIVEIS